jgi:hypothetical protein
MSEIRLQALAGRINRSTGGDRAAECFGPAIPPVAAADMARLPFRLAPAGGPIGAVDRLEGFKVMHRESGRCGRGRPPVPLRVLNAPGLCGLVRRERRSGENILRVASALALLPGLDACSPLVEMP